MGTASVMAASTTGRQAASPVNGGDRGLRTAPSQFRMRSSDSIRSETTATKRSYKRRGGSVAAASRLRLLLRPTSQSSTEWRHSHLHGTHRERIGEAEKRRQGDPVALPRLAL